jgi:glycosyltransferase involved in cell wall biosynthesis
MTTGHYIIIAPCFNEEQVIEQFLKDLQAKLGRTGTRFSVLLVDDSSTDQSLALLKRFAFEVPSMSLHVITLHTNMGHQEAIRQGLQYAYHHLVPADGIIVMDSDGEDDPSAIVKLLEIKTFDIVYVSRAKRQERWPFKVGYFFYRLLFRMVIGKTVSYGNYSMISPGVLRQIHQAHFLHYASFLSRLRVNIQSLPFDRQRRIDGKSKMNYQGLIFHGLMSLVEYSEELLFSLLKAFAGIALGLFGWLCYILYAKFVSETAIAGWASSLGFSLIIVGLVIINTVILGLLLLSIKKTLVQKTAAYEKIRP